MVLLPHLGSASIETRTRMAMIAAENMFALFDGRQAAQHSENPGILEERSAT